jgi:alcohol dehydrogenase class IV
MHQRVIFGRGAVHRVPRLIAALGARRLLLVTGQGSFDACGASRALTWQPGTGESVARFSEFSENPRLEDVELGMRIFREQAPDAVVAVGGGSVLDMAKLVNGLASQPGSPRDVVLGGAPVARRGVPLVAVPTTAGSGSEATHFAVVYVGRSKYSVAGPGLLPDVAVVDPALTASASPQLTAATGMDALAQAIESYWSIHSTEQSKTCARRANDLVLRCLPDAVHTGSSSARRGMSKAAHLAGRAINIT